MTDTIVYQRLTLKSGAVVTIAIAVLTVVCYFILSRYTDSTVPAGDAFTAAVGIVATWMLAHRVVEHWFFWMVSDTVSVGLYLHLGLYPTALLYSLYVIMAVVGYRTWKNKGTVRYD